MKPRATASLATTWACPNCRRRVPRYAAVCHCGARRTDAETAGPTGSWPPGAPRPLGWRDVPLSGWLLLALTAATLVTFVALLFVPIEPPPSIPLLGYVDRGPSVQPKR